MRENVNEREGKKPQQKQRERERERERGRERDRNTFHEENRLFLFPSLVIKSYRKNWKRQNFKSFQISLGKMFDTIFWHRSSVI